MRNTTILLAISITAFASRSSAQVYGEPSPPVAPALPSYSHDVDSGLLRQRDVALRRFLARTRFAPKKGEYAGIYVSQPPLMGAFRLATDTTVTWFNFDIPTDNPRGRKWDLNEFLLTRPPQLSDSRSPSPLDELSGSDNEQSDSYEFHRIDTTVFLVHTSVLENFAEYFVMGKTRDGTQRDFFKSVFIKHDGFQIPRPHTTTHNDSETGMFDALYGLLFLAIWFGGSIYASVVLNRMSKAIGRIEAKLGTAQHEDPGAPA